MNENIDTTQSPQPAESHNALLTKWLKLLFYAQVAGLVILVLTCIPSLSNTLTTWISRIASIVTVVALFQIGPANARYRKAAIFSCIALVCGLLGGFLGSLMALASSICSIVATYQEFNAHCEITQAYDEKLSGKWHSLFYWSMAIGLIVGLISSSGVVIGAVSGVDTGTLTTVMLIVSCIPSIVVQVIYLKYLHKTMAFFAE